MNDEPNNNDSTQNPHIIKIYLMRGLYLLTFISLAYDNWSTIFFPYEQFGVLSGVAISFWASYSLIMGLGVRYPLKMIPMLLLQLIYKAAWIIGTYMPAKSAGTLNEDLIDFYWICVTAVIIDLIIIPWGYVWRIYVADFLNLSKPQTI